MNCEILCRPSAAVAKIQLDTGEGITCEVGSMIAMTSGLIVETTSSQPDGGGMLKGLKRMFAGESFFLNHFTAQAPDQSLIIGPTFIGDIVQHELRGGALLIQGTSWLACDKEISVDSSWQGLGKAMFSGESAFWVKCTGEGSILLNSFGAIYEVDVDGEYVVDTGHIVAFEDSLNFKIRKAGQRLIASFLGGEGLVCRFEGQGKLYCQSHNPPSFGKLLGPKLKPS